MELYQILLLGPTKYQFRAIYSRKYRRIFCIDIFHVHIDFGDELHAFFYFSVCYGLYNHCIFFGFVNKTPSCIQCKWTTMLIDSHHKHSYIDDSYKISYFHLEHCIYNHSCDGLFLGI